MRQIVTKSCKQSFRIPNTLLQYFYNNIYFLIDLVYPGLSYNYLQSAYPKTFLTTVSIPCHCVNFASQLTGDF